MQHIHGQLHSQTLIQVNRNLITPQVYTHYNMVPVHAVLHAFMYVNVITCIHTMLLDTCSQLCMPINNKNNIK